VTVGFPPAPAPRAGHPVPSRHPSTSQEASMSATQAGTAQVQGELWSARADDWAEGHEHTMSPAYEAVLDLAHAGPGMSILEVGCGSGTALRMAADRGAHVTAL